MVLEGGGGASHHGSGSHHRGGQGGRSRSTANTNGGESGVLQQGQTRNHDDFKGFAESLGRFDPQCITTSNGKIALKLRLLRTKRQFEARHQIEVAALS